MNPLLASLALVAGTQAFNIPVPHFGHNEYNQQYQNPGANYYYSGNGQYQGGYYPPQQAQGYSGQHYQQQQQQPNYYYAQQGQQYQYPQQAQYPQQSYYQVPAASPNNQGKEQLSYVDPELNAVRPTTAAS